MALLSFVCLLCSLRTNVPNVIMNFFLVVQYCLLAGVNWTQADGDLRLASAVQKVSPYLHSFLFPCERSLLGSCREIFTIVANDCCSLLYRSLEGLVSWLSVLDGICSQN
jgi:hypothetical protein